MSEGSGGKGESSSTTNVNVPDFLRPLFETGSQVATDAVGRVGELAGEQMVPGFNEDQTAAFTGARDVATGGGGFLPMMQEILMGTAEGRSLSDFLPPEALTGLTGAAAGSGSLDHIDPAALAALRGTAGGDFLAGGEGFDAGVNAAVRSATPHIASAFGGSVGGLSGNSARQAVGDTAIDAFASQYGSERDRMLSASGLLSQLGESGANRSIDASGLLGNFASQERGRQESAARALPDAGLAGSNILRNIGGEQRDLEERQLRSPFESQLTALAAALGIPLGALLGQTTDSEQSGVNLSFG